MDRTYSQVQGQTGIVSFSLADALDRRYLAPNATFDHHTGLR
ncbi:MAG: hypothetical protein HW407_83 [Bacteroidetes bacterium]|jgi:hypothetical protein|nr:hypothetical protein [Bacteroidota bacterium]